MDLATLINTLTPGGQLTFIDGAVAFLLAFLLGHVFAAVYIFTHTGLSYSKSFVQSLLLITIIVTMSMMTIGNNLVVAFGLIGALAVVRFRNILKDTRDTAFVFFSLVVGMALGTGGYVIAVGGTLVFSLVTLYLYWADFGARQRTDAFLRFVFDPSASTLGAVDAILRRYCRSKYLVSQRFEGKQPGEVAYRLFLRDPARSGDLLAELDKEAGVSELFYVLQEEQGEV